LGKTIGLPAPPSGRPKVKALYVKRDVPLFVATNHSVGAAGKFDVDEDVVLLESVDFEAVENMLVDELDRVVVVESLGFQAANRMIAGTTMIYLFLARRA